jgi:hypothetical protein
MTGRLSIVASAGSLSERDAGSSIGPCDRRHARQHGSIGASDGLPCASRKGVRGLCHIRIDWTGSKNGLTGGPMTFESFFELSLMAKVPVGVRFSDSEGGAVGDLESS